MRFNLLGLSIIDWPLNYIRRARFRKKPVINRERDTAAFKRTPGNVRVRLVRLEILDKINVTEIKWKRKKCT